MQGKTFHEWLKLGKYQIWRAFCWNHLETQKWLLVCSYTHYKNYIAAHIEIISQALDKLNISYDNIILMGDFSAKPGQIQITEFLSTHTN